MADLVEGWDSLANRRPSGDPRLPIFVCVGPAADTLVRVYRKRLVSDVAGEAPAIPHALIEDLSAPEGDGDLAFLDKLADGLTRNYPRRMRRLRLPLYWTLRHTLDVPLTQREYHAQRRELIGLLHERSQGERPLAARLAATATEAAGSGTLPIPGRALVRNLTPFLRAPLLAAQRQLFCLRLVSRRRFRALRDDLAKVLGEGGRDFFDVALFFVRNGKERSKASLVRRLLVLGLLLDLDAATAHSFLRPWRRRRTTPFVLLLPAIMTDGAACRFLDTLREVSGRAERGTTFVLASARSDAEPPTWLPDPTSVTDARLQIDAIARAGAFDGGNPPGVIAVTVREPTPEDESWLGLTRKVAPFPGSRPVAVPLAVVVCAFASVIGSIAIAVDNDGTSPSSCAGIRVPEGSDEQIGVGDGSVGCTFFAGAGPEELETDLRQAERAIARENSQVLDTVGEDGDYATVVFFAPP